MSMNGAHEAIERERKGEKWDKMKIPFKCDNIFCLKT